MRMRTWLPVRVERLRWLRGLRRLLRVLGTLPLVLARPQYVNRLDAPSDWRPNAGNGKLGAMSPINSARRRAALTSTRP